MKLFIFKPSPGWDYCGGAVIAIAEDIEKAIILLLDYKDEDGEKELEDNHFYENVEAIPDLKKISYSHAPHEFFYQKREGWDEWVLVESFDVNETKARVVLVNYNYA